VGDLEQRGRAMMRTSSAAGRQGRVDGRHRVVAQRRRGLVEQDEPRAHLVRVRVLGC
jgi:hypothetical protein